MPDLPALTNGGRRARVGPVYAAQPGGRGGGQGREPTWAATAPGQTQQPAHHPSLRCQWHVLSLRMEYSGQPNARPRLCRSQSSSTVPRTHHAIRPAAPSLRLLESDAASGTAAQQRSAGCSVCRPQRDRSQVALDSACGCNTVRVVATQCVWLQHIVLLRHTSVAKRQMSRRAAVATQMWAWPLTRLWCRCGLGWTRADVGWGWTLSQCRCVCVGGWVGGGGGGGDAVQQLVGVGG
jgi:hypothetical protein